MGSPDQQSPIDIRKPEKAQLPDLEIHYTCTRLRVLNNGYTAEVLCDPGNYLIYSGKIYDLIQFHFHTPGEHLIEGRAFPMEAHIVHKSRDGELLVVGVMMEEGERNELIAKVWEAMPSEEGKEVLLEKVKIRVTDLLPSEKGYYTYVGSLTTPPYTGGVRWIIMKKPLQVSREQIDEFKNLFGENARELQPLYVKVLEKEA